LEKFLNGLRGTCTLLHPSEGGFFIEVQDLLALSAGQESSQILNATSLPGKAGIDDDDAVSGLLVAPHAFQTDRNGHSASLAKKTAFEVVLAGFQEVTGGTKVALDKPEAVSPHNLGGTGILETMPIFVNK